MVIGIDIDDTVAKFTEEVEKIAEQYDKSLRKNGIINESSWITKGKYDWSETEIKKFEDFAFEEIIEKLEVKEDAVKYINKLKAEGNNIIFITKRSELYYKTPYESTKKWLDKNKFNYDKIIINADDKAPICKKENVNIFIDDRHSICLDVQASGVKSIMYLSKYNKKYVDKKDVIMAKNWEEVYNLVNQIFLNKSKKNI